MRYKVGDKVWVILYSFDEPVKALVAVTYGEGCIIDPLDIYIWDNEIMGRYD